MKQTHKLLAIILSITLFLSVSPLATFTVSADTTHDYYTFTVTNGCASITLVDNNIRGNITIPSKLNGYTVTRIGKFAFSECAGITGISIPNSIVDIEEGVFSNCPNIASIKVDNANSVYHAKGNCLIATKSKKLILGCKNSIIPDDGSVRIIGYGAFYGCTGLENIIIPSSITHIDYFAFGSCNGLSDIEIPESVTFIGINAFCSCSGLESITVNKNNAVYHSANNCLIDTKEKELISGCKNSIIPDDGSVTKIGASAFEYCTGLENIVIPDTVTSINTGAFIGCRGLKSITISKSVKKIWSFVFSECERLTSVTIPDGVTYIDVCAFSHCTGLESINISKNVTELEDNAFIGCKGLKKITVEEGNPILHSDGNCLIKTKNKKLILGCNESVIPSDGSVTSIGENAFIYCDELKGIVIPEGITSISEAAFYGCSAMKAIVLPKSLNYVGNFAFEFCNNLNDVYYTGTRQQKSGMNILTDCGDNACLLNAEWHYNYVLPCKEHKTTELMNAKKATCTENGYTGDTYCTDCGIKLLDGETIPKTGHKYVWKITKLATATESGLKEELCAYCGEKTGKQQELLYTGHITGDIGGDGAVNNKDLTRLFQYLSDWEVEVNEAALDINGDGSVNNKDLTRLFQYLSDWDVEIF